MAINFETRQVIGCIPTSICLMHPEDQEDCEIWSCPTCHQPMWVSKLKRAHYSLYQGVVEIHCAHCIIKESQKQGYETELVNIAKSNYIKEGKMRSNPIDWYEVQGHHSFAILCPFHTETVPSCFIIPKSNEFHCFGCGAKGHIEDSSVLVCDE